MSSKKPVVDKTFGVRGPLLPVLALLSLPLLTPTCRRPLPASPLRAQMKNKKGAKGQAFVQSVASGKAAAEKQKAAMGKTPEQLEREKLQK
jgi:hypothetical protein